MTLSDRRWSLAYAAAAAVLLGACSASDPVAPRALTPSAPSFGKGHASPVVISQVYGAGGNSGTPAATYNADFVELYNPGTTTVSLSGWSVQYASATGTGNFGAAANQLVALTGSIAPGGYYLVAMTAGTNGAPLPASNASGTIAMAAGAGKVALVDQAGTLGCNGSSTPCSASQLAHIVDLVGYGNANFVEGTGGAPTIGNATAAFRKNNGCTDTNDNAADFATGTPSARNTSSPTFTCPATGLVVTIAPTTPSVGAGTPVAFTVNATFNGSPVTPSSTTWSSSNTSVATIDASGNATTLTAGTSTIGVDVVTPNGNGSATTLLTVTAPPQLPATVTVSPATWTMKVGQTKQLAATAADANGTTVATTFTWSSLNPSVATVDPTTGVVQGKTIGSATIRATSANGVTGDAAITVTSAASLTLTSGKTSLAYGMQTQFFFSGTDATGATISSVTWSTSNASIITVDAKGIVTGKSLGTAQLTATGPDGTSGTVNVTVYLAPGATIPLRLGHNTEFGEPKDADPSDDFLIRRAQYTVSYNPNRGGANWVSWNVDPSHIGDSGRCTGTCYSADTALTNAGLPAYTTADWVSNLPGVTGYDRGHMAPSADWTSSEADNNTTFFLTNFLPQRSDLNQGPWERLEMALRDSVSAGREAYIIAGGIFTNGVGLGTLLNLGKIGIPDSTYKIVILTPLGTGINADGTLPPNTTVMAVNMPNEIGIRATDWRTYLTTIAKIEKSTGYDFLALLADATECRVEVRNCAPTARVTGAGTSGGAEGQTLAFSASTSSDPENDALSYMWQVDGATVGIQSSLTHTFVDDGTYQIRLIVSDPSGGADTASTMVTVTNVAPNVGTLSASTIAEGATYSAAGSFTDPGDDSWTATVDYGDGSGAQPLALSGKTFALSHTYVDDGSYTVKVTVTENDNPLAKDVATTTVTVTNGAPVVASFAGATILRGETYSASGTFTDAGADTWTATVNYGDGTGAQPLALSGKTFSLTHAYTTAGTKTATVTVTDDDGASGQRSAQVIVLSADGGVSVLAGMVDALATAGKLPDTDVTSLKASLDAATKSLAKLNDIPAANQLGAFINKVDALRQSGRLSAADAQALIDYANRVIAAI